MQAIYTTEDKIRRWESRREIKNLMGRYMRAMLFSRYNELYDLFWSSSANDVCLGFNHGWYVGRGAIEGYYTGVYDAVMKTGRLIKKSFPDKIDGNEPSDIYGAGSYNSKPINSAVIEIAGDERTAKGMWLSRGAYLKASEAGTVSYWTWGFYCVDFIYEEGRWKIWHMQYLEDVNFPCGQNWGNDPKDYPNVPGFEDAGNLYADIPSPNIPCTLRERYHSNRPFTPLLPYPEAYETFSKTFSYGYREEGKG